MPKNHKKTKQNLTLINNGISLRDFISLSDVAKIYQKFLKNNYPSGVYDVGTGQGILIKDLINFV